MRNDVDLSHLAGQAATAHGHASRPDSMRFDLVRRQLLATAGQVVRTGAATKRAWSDVHHTRSGQRLSFARYHEAGN
jgi:hypothetical protein